MNLLAMTQGLGALEGLLKFAVVCIIIIHVTKCAIGGCGFSCGGSDDDSDDDSDEEEEEYSDAEDEDSSILI